MASHLRPWAKNQGFKVFHFLANKTAYSAENEYYYWFYHNTCRLCLKKFATRYFSLLQKTNLNFIYWNEICFYNLLTTQALNIIEIRHYHNYRNQRDSCPYKGLKNVFECQNRFCLMFLNFCRWNIWVLGNHISFQRNAI